MGATFDAVKNKALTFAQDLNEAMKTRHQPGFTKTRIRALFFHDFDGNSATGDEPPLVASQFFEMPAQSASYRSFVNDRTLRGGWYDYPESGNECLDAAIQSNWKSSASPDEEYFPIVVIWSDADAKKSRRVNSLTAHWNSSSVIDQKNKAIIHYGLCTNPVSSTPGWSEARALSGYVCGGPLSAANNDIVGKLADSIVARYGDTQLRLTN